MKVDATAPDQPLVMHLRVEVPQFAKQVAGGLSLHPPFLPNLAQLAALPVRHTPILRRAAWHAEVRVKVNLPESFGRMPADVARGEQRANGAMVVVRDAVGPHAIDFDRLVDVPAGRVQPGAEYEAWQKFVRDADALLSRDVTVGK
jgi:hypothetical protein